MFTGESDKADYHLARRCKFVYIVFGLFCARSSPLALAISNPSAAAITVNLELMRAALGAHLSALITRSAARSRARADLSIPLKIQNSVRFGSRSTNTVQVLHKLAWFSVRRAKERQINGANCAVSERLNGGGP